MQRLITFLLRSVPMWLVVLIFYGVGGLIAGFAGSVANMVMGGTASILTFTIGGGIGGLLLGIWVVLTR